MSEAMTPDMQEIDAVSQNTGPQRLIRHNFDNSQRLLIIFCRQKHYSILS